MDWIKDYCASDSHPQMVAAGFWGATTFRLLCRLSGAHKLNGRIPPTYANPAYLAAVSGLAMYPGTIKATPEALMGSALDKLVEVGLLVRDGDDYVIDGWDRKQGQASSTERVQVHRARKRGLVDAPPNETDQSVSTVSGNDETTKTDKTDRHLSAQEEFFRWAQGERIKAMGAEAVEERIQVRKLNATLKKPLADVGVTGLKAAYAKFLEDSYALGQGLPFGLFVAQWTKYHGLVVSTRSAPGKGPGAAKARLMRVIGEGEDVY